MSHTDPSWVEHYLDSSTRADALSGGARLIPIRTPAGTFNVWTKRRGNDPRTRLLLLHGGPGITHEYFEACDTWLPAAGIEYYYYDQLGSFYSDQPDQPDLWELDRFVDEVEQVRQALDLDDFYLLGQSWGGILALEYALQHQQHLRGLIISNMMASAPAYNRYAHDVLSTDIPADVLAEIKNLEAQGRTEDPRFMELLVPHHDAKHVLRMSPEDWPEPVQRAFAHLNPAVYVPMQGPSELGVSGKLVDWDRTADLPSVEVPTLMMGAQHDTMDPSHMEWMATAVARGRYHHCANGSHLSMYDDQATWFAGLIQFIRDVDSGSMTSQRD